MNRTSVVNVRSDRYDVWIGREDREHDGYYGNPFVIGVNGRTREEAIETFRGWFLQRMQQDPDYRRKVMWLKGKRLGCVCAPEPCHGDVIAEWLDGSSGSERRCRKISTAYDSNRRMVLDRVCAAPIIRMDDGEVCTEGHVVAASVATSYVWLAGRGVTVLDPDGWDRTRLEDSMLELITKEEFERRLSMSTVTSDDR